MIDFWLPALAMAVVALGFALWPMFRGRSESRAARIRAHSNLAIYEDRLAELEADRDEGRITGAEYGVLRAELERVLLTDLGNEEDATAVPPQPARRGTAVMIGGGLFVPLLALVLYADWGLALGYLDDLALARELEAVEQMPTAGHDRQEVAGLIRRLETRLEADPADADGWFLLGRTALNHGDFERSAEAFGRVAALLPEEVTPRVYQAQALYLAEDRQLTPRVRAVVDRVLELAPGQPIMLELLAMEAFQRGRFADAANLFQQVLASGVPEGERRRFLVDALTRARELAELPATLPEPGARVRVLVEADPGAEIPPGAVLFVFAREVGGPPLPLAAARYRAGDLPLLVALDDSMAMTPDRRLSSADQVEIVARVSTGGDVVARPGDLEGVSGAIDPRGGNRVVNVLIDRVVE